MKMMPDSSRWDVPAQIVIDDFERQYGHAPEDDHDLIDWAAGNMDWKDVVEHAPKVIDRAPMSADEFQEGWVNGPKEVVDVQVVEGVAFVPLTDVDPPGHFEGIVDAPGEGVCDGCEEVCEGCEHDNGERP
ncbi:MAG: hypothetical protein MUC88_00380 [Planctomycetes bacterium]|jgi:hypothetical protein|nr:hypothetical protein [Planctomycetota bacterium]